MQDLHNCDNQMTSAAFSHEGSGLASQFIYIQLHCQNCRILLHGLITAAIEVISHSDISPVNNVDTHNRQSATVARSFIKLTTHFSRLVMDIYLPIQHRTVINGGTFEVDDSPLNVAHSKWPKRSAILRILWFEEKPRKKIENQNQNQSLITSFQE